MRFAARLLLPVSTLALCLTGCSSLSDVSRTAPAEKAELAALPEAALKGTPGPAKLPEGDLTVSTLLPFLYEDRANLRACTINEASLIRMVRQRDAIQGR